MRCKPCRYFDFDVLIFNGFESDIYPGDNYWSGTRRKIDAARMKALKEKNPEEAAELEKKYRALNEMSFQRRVQAEAEERNGNDFGDDFDSVPSYRKLSYVIKHAQFSTQTDEVKELAFQKAKNDMVKKRRGLFNLFPKIIHRLFDYISSLKKPPSKQILVRNVAFGILFAIIMLYNTGRRATTFGVAGNLVMCSLLLSRGMPEKKNSLGMDRTAVNWSTPSWTSAFGITAMFSLPTVLVAKLVFMLWFPKLSAELKWSASLACGVLAAAIGTSFYEVFESKSNSGWRWRNVEHGYLPPAVEAKLRKQVFGEKTTDVINDMEEGYEFEYNPDVDDEGIVNKQSKLFDKMAGVNVQAEQAHYEQWVQARKEKFKEPSVTYTPSEVERLIGAKSQFFDVPEDAFIEQGYREVTTRLNPWRKKKLQFKKNFVDEPIVGPYAFRDKTPEWLKEFSEIFTDKVTQRQKMARSYGSYRKSMYKKDSKVVLLPSDGAKEQPPALPSDGDDEQGDGNGIDDFLNEQDDQL